MSVEQILGYVNALMITFGVQNIVQALLLIVLGFILLASIRKMMQ